MLDRIRQPVHDSMAVDIPVSQRDSAARAVIEQAGAALAARRKDIPATFVAQLYARAVAEDVLATRRLISPRWPSGRSIFSGTHSRRAENPLRQRDAERIGRPQVGRRDRDRQRRHAVPGRFGDGRTRRAPPRMCGWWRIRCSALSARAPAQGSRTRPMPPEGAARELHPYPSRADRGRDDARRHRARASSVLGEVRLAVQDWRPMLGCVNGRGRRSQNQSAAAAGRRNRRSDRSSCNGCWPTISPSSACATTPSRRQRARRPDYDSALGIMRARELRVLKQRQRAARIHAGDHGVPERAAAADHRQGQYPRPRAPARLSRLYRHQALRCFGGNLVGEQRIVGLFTSTAYTRTAHSIPYLRRKIASVERAPASTPSSHSGKALANVLENYPRDELFQVDEDTLYHFALAILQLDERPRVRVLARRDRFDRFVSVLVFVPRERYDSHIRATDRRLSRQRLHRARLGVLSVLPGRPAGARALHHRPLRRRRARGRRAPRWSARSRPSCARGPMG